MKEIVVLSGKGGTGKTSITAALAALQSNAIFCDCDVDAADLHLILNPQVLSEHQFPSSVRVEIDQQACIGCGLCQTNCRFGAISSNDNGYRINALLCEACLLCEKICPQQAISSKADFKNRWMLSDTRFGKLIHARMAAGEENSGRLVAQVRSTARDLAKENEVEVIITDGPPGIGCPVISSLSKADHVLLVAEPSKSSLHDLKRLVRLIKDFNIPMSAIVNKYDLFPDMLSEFKLFFEENDIPLLAGLPFESRINDALNSRKTVVEHLPDSIISGELERVNTQLMKLVFEKKDN